MRLSVKAKTYELTGIPLCKWEQFQLVAGIYPGLSSYLHLLRIFLSYRSSSSVHFCPFPSHTLTK